ncbi:MAG: hypothetical protein KBD19_03385 [Candidatus Moranbacteria bacterium]|nr:hypothetical protein [Candidatus Moranbacteria bacterium]
MFSERPKNSEDSVRTLFNEASRRAHDEGIETYDEWRDLVQGLLQEKVNEGMFDIDEDIPSMEKDLEMMWSEAERTLQ